MIDKDEFFVQRMKAEMQARKLTQIELANIAGITQSTLSNTLRGKVTQKKTLEKIAVALNVNPDYFLEEACLKKEIDLNIEIYQKCSNIVLEALKNENIKVNSEKIQLLQGMLYKAVLYKNLSLDKGEAFIAGIIEYGVSLGIFLRIEKEND